MLHVLTALGEPSLIVFVAEMQCAVQFFRLLVSDDVAHHVLTLPEDASNA